MESIRDSSSVVLTRDRDEQLEVFLVRRHERLGFFGGYWAFPGGGFEAGDEATPVAGLASDGGDRLAIPCAARELWEETGVLVGVHGALIASPGGDPEDPGAFLEALARVGGGAVDAARFLPLTRLVTPQFSRRRHDTRFFVVDVHERDLEPRVESDELEEGRWWTPRAALHARARGELDLAPPAIAILERLTRRSRVDARAELNVIPRHFEGSGLAIPWGPGVELLPFHTPPLPADIPTHAMLIGSRKFLLVDPAPSDPDGQAHLVTAVERRIARGDELVAILLTHHHNDHVGGLDAMLDRFDAPLWAHPRSGELLERPLARSLEDRDRIALGESPDGRDGWELTCLFTPGHAQGHISLLDSRYAALFAGDMVSTILSMYVGSPGGHLRSYLDSIERLARLPLRILYPSHGPPSRNPAELLQRTRAHRLARVEEMAARLGPESRTVDELASEVYRGMAEALRPLFVRTTRATLEYLAEDGRAERVDEDAFRAT